MPRPAMTLDHHVALICIFCPQDQSCERGAVYLWVSGPGGTGLREGDHSGDGWWGKTENEQDSADQKQHLS